MTTLGSVRTSPGTSTSFVSGRAPCGPSRTSRRSRRRGATARVRVAAHGHAPGSRSRSWRPRAPRRGSEAVPRDGGSGAGLEEKSSPMRPLALTCSALVVDLVLEVDLATIRVVPGACEGRAAPPYVQCHVVPSRPGRSPLVRSLSANLAGTRRTILEVGAVLSASSHDLWVNAKVRNGQATAPESKACILYPGTDLAWMCRGRTVPS